MAAVLHAYAATSRRGRRSNASEEPQCSGDCYRGGGETSWALSSTEFKGLLLQKLDQICTTNAPWSDLRLGTRKRQSCNTRLNFAAYPPYTARAFSHFLLCHSDCQPTSLKPTSMNQLDHLRSPTASVGCEPERQTFGRCVKF